MLSAHMYGKHDIRKKVFVAVNATQGGNMKQAKYMLVIIIVIVLMTACQKEDSTLKEDISQVDNQEDRIDTENQEEDREEKEDDKKDEEQENSEVEENEIDEAVIEAVRTEFTGLLESDSGILSIKNFVDTNIALVDESLADEMLAKLIKRASEQSLEEMNDLYTADNVGIHSRINDVYTAHKDVFELGHIFLGEDKALLVNYIENDHYKDVLKTMFDKGYGIYSAEGSFYPVVDYIELLNSYEKYISNMTMEYFIILSDSIISPTTTEEYLAVTPEKLKERAYESEQFLIDYPEAPLVYKDNIKQNLLVCIWKLSGPSPFDGILKEDFTLSDEMLTVYEDIIAEERVPVVLEAVEGVMEWIDTKEGGVLGSFDNMEEMFKIAGELYSKAGENINNYYITK